MSMKNENDNRNRKKQMTIVAIILIIILLLSLSRCSFGATDKPINDNTSNTSDVKDDEVEVTKPSGGSDSNNSNQKPSDKPSGGDTPTDKPSTPDTDEPETPTPDPKPEEKPKPEPTPDPEPEEPQKPSHTHNWVAVKDIIHHEEKGHYETVCVKEAWDEKVPVYGYENRSICNACGADITGNVVPHVKNHALNGETSGHHTELVKVQTGTDTVHHDAEYEQQWVVDKAAWDEEVITGYTCSCGATK